MAIYTILFTPSGYMDLIEGVLRDRRILSSSIHVERFSFSSPDLTFPDKPLVIGRAPGSPGGLAQLIVRLSGEQCSIEMRGGETVLDAALRSGLNPPYACQEGVCASCKASLVSGCVRVLRHEALTPLEVKQNSILTCQAIALSREIVVSFDK